MCGTREVVGDRDMDQREMALTTVFEESQVTVTMLSGTTVWGPQVLPRQDISSILKDELRDLAPAGQRLVLVFGRQKLAAATHILEEVVTINAIFKSAESESDDDLDDLTSAYRRIPRPTWFFAPRPRFWSPFFWPHGVARRPGCYESIACADIFEASRHIETRRLRRGERRRKASRYAPRAVVPAKGPPNAISRR